MNSNELASKLEVFGMSEWDYRAHSIATKGYYENDYDDVKVTVERLANLCHSLGHVVRISVYDSCIGLALKNDGFNETQAGIIQADSYEDAHSGGYDEVMEHVFEIVNFLKKLEAAA